MGDRSLEVFVRSWTLVQSSGGAFEVTVNGDLIFSKKNLGRHAEAGEVKSLIREKLESLLPEGIQIPEPDTDQ